ncbi:MAG: hypothetical protein HWE30_19225 [Methylocystaceae bacterium]|nr:hypothetical protein [Methylocystaceae bacterium]
MSDLYIHCTAKLAKAMKVKFFPSPDAKKVDPLNCWYANVLKIGLPLDIVLYTHATTYYSLVHPFDRRDPADYTMDVFGQRLNEILGRSVATAYDYIFCKTASRKVLGCMNESAFVLEIRARDMWGSGEDVELEELEGWLNRRLIAGVRPADEFEALVQDSKNKAPYLRVVK